LAPRNRIELQLRTRPDSGVRPPPSAWGVRQALNILLLIPGVFVGLLALGVYPPVDTRVVMGFLLGFFLLPVALQIFSLAPRAVYVSASAALVLLGLLLLLNGRLDKSPASEVKTTVLRKTVLRGRRGTQYDLAVSSWRPGRTLEHFKVTSREFDRAVVGKIALVELHKGFLGLPWYGEISPE
jgi:hypothetical protein